MPFFATILLQSPDRSSMMLSVIIFGYFDISWRPKLFKSSPNYVLTFGTILKNVTFEVKRLRLVFWHLLVKIGLIFIPSSGHTAAAAATSTCKVIDLATRVSRLRQNMWGRQIGTRRHPSKPTL